MPNRTGAALKDRRKRSKKSEPETLDQIIQDSETEISEVPTTTDERPQVPDFTADIEDAPEDYKPNRSPAGRTRIPSQFDELLPKYHGKGWKRIQHDGNVEIDDNGKATPESVKGSNAHVIKRELQKAQHHLKLGMDLNITGTHVEFKVRDLQKRKAKDGEQADAEGNVIDELDDDYAEDVED